MQNDRHNARVICSRKCILQLHDSFYPATVTNLSIVALSVHFDGSRPDVKIGDDCVVFFDGIKKPYPFELNFQVIRIGTSDIVLSCMDLLPYS